jgi:GNAT superfamily N-acetyltransferase
VGVADPILRWHARSPDDADECPRALGVETALCEALDRDGNRIGRLRASYTTRELATALFPDALLWMITHRGWGHHLTRDSDPADVWLAAARHQQLPRLGKAPWSVTAADLPADAGQLSQDLEELAAAHRRDFDRWIAYAEIPFVVHIRVDEPHRRRGIATALYERTAVELGRTGRVLRASSSQEPEAAACWAKMRTAGHTTTVAVPERDGRTVTYDCLDRRT